MGKQPEGKLSTKIMDALRKRGAYAWKVHGSEYQPAGTPDISIIYKGWSLWAETKMPGNKPSLIQWKRMRDMRRAGALTCVPYSVQDAVQMLDHIDSGDHTHDEIDCLYSAPIDLKEIIASGNYAKAQLEL